MDSLAYKELATCSICFELFSEDSRCPRVLPCGHTFCHTCLEKILVQSPFCPTCKAGILAHKAEFIPVNYTIAKSLIYVVNQIVYPDETQSEAMPNKKANSKPSKLKYEGFCKEHSNVKEFRCMDCESWICGACGVMKHKHCRTLLVEEAYKELKDQAFLKVEKELESMKITNAKIEHSLKYFEEQRHKLKEKMKKYEVELKECEQRINKLYSLKSEFIDFSKNVKQIQTEVMNSANDTEFSKIQNKLDELLVQEKSWSTQLDNLKFYPYCPTTIEELKKFCQENGDCYVEDNENEPLYGKVTVMAEQIRISSFSPTKPNGHHRFPFKEFLLRFGGISDLPSTVYMKLNRENYRKEFDLVIETKNGTSPSLSKNFVLHCSALRRHTYKGMILTECGKTYDLVSDLPHVVEDLIISSICKTNKIKRGCVYKINKKKSGFSIAASDYFQTQSSYTIGEITSGFQELYNWLDDDVVIEDCGLVVNINHTPVC